MNRWWWSVGMAVAVLSGTTALALLMLPLLLLLLMVLFDSAMHGLMVLLGLIATWLQALLPPGDGSLPAYGAIALDPLSAAARAAFRSAPCLLGLVLVLLSPRPVSPGPVSPRSVPTRSGVRWWCITVLWVVAAAVGGRLVAVALLPGLVATLMLAIRSGAPRRR